MKSVTKHICSLGLLIVFTLLNVEVCHAGDLTGYDADGDGLTDYLDDSGNLWPNQQAWEESSALVTAFTGEDTATIESVTPPIDTDGDGLTDEEEEALGTNPLLIDTDGGGLSDYEEVNTDDWRQTDPLNPYDDSPNVSPTDQEVPSDEAGNNMNDE
ncbi:MAG: hypothetical protein Q8M07_13935, partial [Prosthecobacter sp.]|nr:hypothetical protein [Prosthecobacter sp.]